MRVLKKDLYIGQKKYKNNYKIGQKQEKNKKKQEKTRKKQEKNKKKKLLFEKN